MADAAPRQTTAAPLDTSVLNLLALGNFVVGMGAFVVVGIVTPIADGLDIAKADAAIVLTAYAVAYAVLSPVGVALTGTLPRRAVLAGALALFGAGSIVSALSGSLPILTASRVLVAFGAALYTPLSAGVAVAMAAPEHRGRALARVFGGITAAQVVGVPLGAWLAYRFGWQAPFWTASGLALAGAAVLSRRIPRDISFQVTTIAAVLGSLKNGALMYAVSFTATIITAINIVFTYFGPLIEASAGTNPETRTFYLILFGIGAVAGNYIGGAMSDRIGPRWTLLIICVAQMALMPVFSLSPMDPILFAVMVAIWSSFGWSFMAPQQSRLVTIAPEAQTLALALNAAMIYVGIASGSGIAAVLLDRWGLMSLGIAGGIGAGLAAVHLWISSRRAMP